MSEAAQRAKRKYKRTPKGRIAKKSYEQSEAGKAAIRRYRVSAKGRRTGRISRIRRDYGATQEELDRLLAEFGQPCPICRCEAASHIDHDHKTNHIRATLCRFCNMLLGAAKDNVPTLLRAVQYLLAHSRAIQ